MTSAWPGIQEPGEIHRETFMFTVAPKLRKVSGIYDQYEISEHEPHIHMPWQQMEELQEIAGGVNDLLYVLGESPNLTRVDNVTLGLTLYDEPMYPHAVSRIRHPLRSLDLHVLNEPCIRKLIRNLELPLLVDLRVDYVMEPWTPELWFLFRSFLSTASRLQRLVLRLAEDTLSNHGFFNILRAIPGLLELEIGPAWHVCDEPTVPVTIDSDELMKKLTFPAPFTPGFRNP